ncbi:MAG TPA: hypothetical protein VGH54_10305 [Mycobacterium sp.]|jgi:hypothetical protein|uniref:hypothetical protein n=1 Tax=Mycobacterium sp. TaxID=1785 RepID=UPI002F41451F
MADNVHGFIDESHVLTDQQLHELVGSACDVERAREHPDSSQHPAEYIGKHASLDATDRPDNGYAPKRVNERQQVELRYFTAGSRWRAFAVAV